MDRRGSVVSINVIKNECEVSLVFNQGTSVTNLTNFYTSELNEISIIRKRSVGHFTKMFIFYIF